MAGAFVQSFVNSTLSNVTSLAVTLSGTTSNNLLVATVSIQDTSGTINTPSGWTKREDNTTDFSSGAIFDRISDGAETTVNFTWTTSQEPAIVVCEYSGLDSTAPFEASGENTTFANSDQVSGGTINTGSATPVSANGLAIAHHMGPDERDVNDSELSIDNSYTKHVFTTAAVGNNPISSQASKVYTTTAAQSPDWDTSRTNAWRAYCAIAVYKEPAAGGITGTGAFTLADVTVSSTGTVDIDGIGAFTFDNVVVASTGTVDIDGIGAFTFDDVTVSSTGTTGGIVGIGAFTLDDVIVSSTGTVAINGVGTLTFDDVTVASVGTVAIDGIGSFTLADVTTISTGTVAIDGIGSFTLDGMTVSGSDTVILPDVLIDGAATKVLTVNFQSTTLYFNGSNYFTID